MNCSKGLNTKVILNLIATISLTLTASLASAAEFQDTRNLRQTRLENTRSKESDTYAEKKNKPSTQKPDFAVPDGAPNQPLAPNEKYPNGPDAEMTPGKLCEHGKTRYAQQITYCERNVSSGEKNAIIADYDNQLGFKIRSMDRMDFKIDHFIPLSIGGSNDAENLWPQHKSVYAYSDKLELLLFQAMEADKIKQMDAIRVIKECKTELTKCSGLEDYVSGLMQ